MKTNKKVFNIVDTVTRLRLSYDDIHETALILVNKLIEEGLIEEDKRFWEGPTWSLQGNGSIIFRKYAGAYQNKIRKVYYDQGNLFATKEEAESERDRRASVTKE